MYSLVVWPSRSRSSLTRSCRSMGIWAHKFLVVAILGYLLVFCNASIPERLRESYYQHHQGMIDKRSESNISTNVTEKAAVLSHMGSRTAACLLILHSFLASVFKSHQSARVLCCISEMSPLARKNWNVEKSSFCNFFILKVAHYMWKRRTFVRRFRRCIFHQHILAEAVGFEPTCPCGQLDFESSSLRPLRYASV